MVRPRAFTPGSEKEKRYYGQGIQISQSFGEIEMHHGDADCGFVNSSGIVTVGDENSSEKEIETTGTRFFYHP